MKKIVEYCASSTSCALFPYVEDRAAEKSPKHTHERATRTELLQPISGIDTPLADLEVRVVSVERAGALLRLSRASAYRAAHRWLETNGAEGLPVVVLSRRRMVVPVAALERLLETARGIAS